MKLLGKSLGLVLCVCIIGIALSYDKINRLLIVNSFFEADNIVSNFQDTEEIFPSTNISPSSNPLVLPTRIDFSFPESFSFEGQMENTNDFLDKSRTEGLLVIHRDTIIYEEYLLGLEKDEKHISWSMSKSFIGTMIGMVVERGLLELDDLVIEHLPEFKDTGYENVSVLDLLQMRSGVRFVEDYSDYNSDINRFGRAFALGSSYREFAQSLKNEVPPGSRCTYISIDTQMLGFLLSKVTGLSLTQLLGEYLWEPLGMEHNGGWIVDNTGFEMALGGITASLRDYAKLGLLYLHEGKLNNTRIVSKDWIKKATSPYLMKDGTAEINAYGYGYQWWIPAESDGDYFAVGIYDQFVYVNPSKDLVVAKLSADHNFKFNGPQIKAKHIAMFQEIARGF